jgi:long-chain acyl-CoA synthetase
MVPPWHIGGATAFRSVLRAGRAHMLDDVALTREDVAFLQYTGGTTGVAKGAMLTHGNLVANIQQMSAWMARDLREGEETIVIPLPLYHVYALTSNLVFMKLGAHCVLITNPRDLPAFIEELKRSRFTAIIGVNTLYSALIDAPGFSQVDVSRLRLISAGGMAVQRVVAQKWKQATGVAIIEGYGLTETSPVAIASPLGVDEWTGTIGVPIPSTEAAILDDQGNEVPVGEVGEICIRGPQVMKGYWNRPEETTKVFTEDGWFRTGDMGFMDERGYFKITDRKKDMIIVSGFKVFPNEVEDVVSMHAGVLEVACVGTSDEKSGEVVKIVVVRKDPELTAEDLIEHCKKHLTGYKVPKSVEFRTEPLPKTNIGKILRRELRDAAATRDAGSRPLPAA